MNPFGNYTVAFADGSYRTYRVQPDKKGKIAISRRVGKRREIVGNLWVTENGQVKITIRKGIDTKYRLRFYTYIYSREGVPFYVGKGTNGRVDHDHEGRRPNDPSQIQIKYWHSEAAAYEHEKQLIEQYGRMDIGTGTLENLTAGGGGIRKRTPAPSVLSDFDIILGDPEEAALAFALHSQRCSRCERPLTVPASISKGLGPECAQKPGWTKGDNAAAFVHLLNTAGPSALQAYLNENKPKPKESMVGNQDFWNFTISQETAPW